MDEKDWLVSWKKTFRLFLRRIYLSNKTNRDREPTRPHYEEKNERNERRPRHSYIFNVALISVPFACYFFLLSPSPRFTEISVEKPLSMGHEKHIANEERHELVKDRVTVDKKKLNISVTTKIIKEENPALIESRKRVPSDFIIIEEKATSSSTLSPITKLPTCSIHTDSMDTKVKLHLSDIESFNNTHLKVQKGGYYKPDQCLSEHKVAIIVPYRNRTENLNTFLYNIHPFLMAQNLEYRIFVIEQFGNKKFNKGRLFNAGFKELKKFGSWRCVVLHDVDLLPLDRRIFYTCPPFPRHMSSYVTNNGYNRKSSSVIMAGGVTAMSLQHYQKINGHSNLYWGWGGEDLDMYGRIRAAGGLMIKRYNKTIARYYHLSHDRAPENPLRLVLLSSAFNRWEDEGLNNVEYTVVSVTSRPLCTHILVNIHPQNDDTVPNTIVTSKPIITAYKYINRNKNSRLNDFLISKQ